MPGTRASVAIVQRVVPHYREAFFAALHHELAARGVELRVLYGMSEGRGELQTSHASWSEQLRQREFVIAGQRLTWQPALRRLRDADLVIVEQSARLLLNYVLLAWQPLAGPRVAYWGHGKNFDVAGASHVGEAVKRWSSRLPRWWFAYTSTAARVVEELGYPRERITVVQNATDTDRLRTLMADIDVHEVARLRGELGVLDGHVGLFVGSLHAAKRLPFLLAAADAIHAELPDFWLIIAGEGPLSDEIRCAAEERPWVQVVGACYGRELARLFALAHVLLVPGWVGLVAVDSFAAGVPIVTSRSAPHPPEAEYLEDGVNALLVDDGGNPARYGANVVALLRDEERRARLVAGCRAASRTFTATGMARRFADGVAQALAT